VVAAGRAAVVVVVGGAAVIVVVGAAVVVVVPATGSLWRAVLQAARRRGAQTTDRRIRSAYRAVADPTSVTVQPMPHIHVIPPEEAQGSTKRGYDEALQRAGRIWNIVSIMGQNGETLRASMGIYRCIMFGESPLSRAQREMIAVVTSQANDCHY
jgi:hypothetical protein